MSRLTAIVGGRAATVNSERPYIDDAVVIVEDRHITVVGARGEHDIPADAEIIDASGCAIIPGLVNCHTHVPQILLRGGPSSDRHLFDWMFTALYPGLAEYSAEDIASGYRLYGLEALRAGVTTIVANDHVGPGDYVAAAKPAIEALDDIGLRAFYGRMFSDSTPDDSGALLSAVRARRPKVAAAQVRRDTTQVLADLDRLIRTYHHRSDGRIQIIPSPSTASATSIEALQACDRIATDTTGLWTLHVSETPADRPTPPLSALSHLAAHRLLSPHLLAGHCVHLDESDLRLLSRHDVAVSTQPVSNGVLGSGIAPVPQMLLAGLRVGLGTDDANCNDGVNPLADLKTLGVVQRAASMDVSVLNAEELLSMATLGGAAALGIADQVGSLEVGKRADLCVLSLRHAHLTPASNLAATLVWQANGSEIRDVLIDGEIVLRDRRARFLERVGSDAEAELLDDAATRSARIVASAGLD